MTPWLWGFVVGLGVGANVGVFLMALLVAAKDGDRHLDPTSRHQAEMEQRVWDAANRSNE